MAKAKKAASGSGTKKTDAAAKARKAPSPVPAPPLIDTSLAAAAAAKMVASKTSRVAGDAERPESSTFKQLKESLAKPAAASLGGVLGTVNDSKRSNLPASFGKQVGRNQTFGADVNRAGVPRRTGG